MTCFLEELEGHYLQIIPNSKGWGRGIKANITGHHTCTELCLQARRQIVDHTSPSQFFYEGIRHLYSFILVKQEQK
jgi:hypothetical protein